MIIYRFRKAAKSRDAPQRIFCSCSQSGGQPPGTGRR